MLGDKELPGHLSANPSPVPGRHRRITGQTGRLVDGRDPFRDLTPERAHLAIQDLERNPEPGHGQVVDLGEVRPRELLDSLFGEGVHTGAEQCPHLVRRYRVAGVEAVDAGHARTDPDPGLFAAIGVVGRQASVALLRRIQRGHLPGQVVIPRPGGQLVHAHRHTHIGRYEPLGGHLDGVRSAGAPGVWHIGSWGT
jgi:hypothetical protein